MIDGQKSVRFFPTIIVFSLFLGFSGACFGQDNHPGTGSAGSASTMPGIPDVLEIINKATADESDGSAGEWASPVKLVVIFALLAIIPSLLAMTTSFTRIVIVLGFARRAISTQSIPPTIAVIGLAMFLTLYTMAPTFYRINNEAIQPYIADEMDFGELSSVTGEIMKEFMIHQTRRTDLALFIKMAKIEQPDKPMNIPFHIVVPSFIVSEFRTAFEIGCLLFIPFLLLDLVVASILLSAGMMMLPPVMISLPFKLILFILVDGWGILAHSLSLSFR
ncbi:MAG TPA: flagellar type III secretion system pore protein FliP [Planctomycetes bacterium]|nr:flagellar type III secretion system pore protein FliP [Planctomycetota bacterium]